MFDSLSNKYNQNIYNLCDIIFKKEILDNKWCVFWYLRHKLICF